MKRFAWLALVLAVATVACSHKQQQNQASAESNRSPLGDQTEVYGQSPAVPVYPRAQLVALPGQPIAPPANPAPPVATTSAAPSAAEMAAPAPAPTVPAPSSPVPTAPTPAPAVSTTPPTDLTSTNSPPAGAADEMLDATNTVAAITPPSASPLDNTGSSPASTPPETDTNAPTTAVALTNDIPTPPIEAKTDDVQVVVLQTTFGRMVLQLDDFAAPKTCANFRNLVSAGFYNGTIFHRVIPHFIIQGGDPNSKTDNRATYGQGDPGYSLPAEIKLSHDRGAVAMARLPDTVNPARDSNGSQFYICVEACPSLDDKYTVFAHVIEGMDVAERIANVPRDQRDDPLVRIAMDARLEPKSQVIQNVPAATH